MLICGVSCQYQAVMFAAAVQVCQDLLIPTLEHLVQQAEAAPETPSPAACLASLLYSLLQAAPTPQHIRVGGRLKVCFDSLNKLPRESCILLYGHRQRKSLHREIRPPAIHRQND